jgi:hypothetical protein
MKYIIILAIVNIIVGPFITIWSLNTLFPVLAISYSFYTWIAVIALHATIRGIFLKDKE